MEHIGMYIYIYILATIVPSQRHHQNAQATRNLRDAGDAVCLQGSGHLSPRIQWKWMKHGDCPVLNQRLNHGKSSFAYRFSYGFSMIVPFSDKFSWHLHLKTNCSWPCLSVCWEPTPRHVDMDPVQGDLVENQKSIESMAIEIVSFPHETHENHGDFP